MKLYPPGMTVKVRIDFIDLNGDPVEPTSIVASVIDENGEELDRFSPPFSPGDTDVEVSVPGILNGIQGVSGMRVVVLEMTTTDGDIPVSASYMLRAGARLEVLKNTFQTYEMATLLSADMVNLTGWELSDPDRRKSALIEAFRRLTRLNYRINSAPAMDALVTIPDRDRRILPSYWPYMTVDQWTALPQHFRSALCLAQITEASEMLTGDTVTRKRQQGLLSESIGESSMMFQSGKPLDLGVNAVSLKYIQTYIDQRIKIVRT